MEDNFNEGLKSFLEKVGNRWVISPDPEIFSEPNNPIVERHIDDLKNYIRLMPKPYTTDLFEKVKVAREKKLKDIESREKVTGIKKREEEIDAGTETAIEGFKEKGGGCFSLRSEVILASGERIVMSQLSVGDKVCCGEKNGKLIFSEIYAIIHADDQAVTQYQRIDYLTADGTKGDNFN
jgi:hypothetical protein